MSVNERVVRIPQEPPNGTSVADGVDAGDQTPLVSVIMPFFNVAPFLAEAIESVRAQSYPHWELLLADDGATDGSTEIARRYVELDPGRIRHLEHEGRHHLGASAARNLALDQARGEMIAFLDGDDVWRPRKLAEQVALLRAHPEADALCGSTELWYGWTGEPADAARDRVLRIGVPHGSFWPAPTFLARRLRGRTASPATCSLIVRRSAVQRAGSFEESFRAVYTDQSFYAKLFLHASLLVVDTCWDRYRQHAASAYTRARSAGEMQERELQYLLWVSGYLDAQQVRDRQVRGALRQALWRARHPRAAQVTRRVRHAAHRLLRLALAMARRARAAVAVPKRSNP